MMNDNTPFFSHIEYNNKVRCELCPLQCQLSSGEAGSCGTRANENGRLKVITHGRFRAIAIDPVEKKPLFHYLPGTNTFSVGTDGCNLICPFCQNASLSQAPRSLEYAPSGVRQWTPEKLVSMALGHNCQSISFTYSEPVLSLEFILDTAPLALTDGLGIIVVTNGQIRTEPLEALCGAISAANVDLKSFSSTTYRDILKGHLKTTLKTIEQLYSARVWMEISTLVVPDLNDSDGELYRIASFIAGISPHIPWHVSRFHPAYMQMDVPPTSMDSMRRALDAGAKAGLHHVYAGNAGGTFDENTYCPNCKDVLVHRAGFQVNQIFTHKGECPGCGWHIAGVGFP